MKQNERAKRIAEAHKAKIAANVPLGTAKRDGTAKNKAASEINAQPSIVRIWPNTNASRVACAASVCLQKESVLSCGDMVVTRTQCSNSYAVSISPSLLISNSHSSTLLRM